MQEETISASEIFFFFKWEPFPEAPSVETYHWPDELHANILSQGPARNGALRLTEISQGHSRAFTGRGQAPGSSTCLLVGRVPEEVQGLQGRRGGVEVEGNRC